MKSILSSYLFLFKNIKYAIIFLFILLSFSYQYIIKQVNNKYPKVKELPSGEFFVIMDNGIYF